MLKPHELERVNELVADLTSLTVLPADDDDERRRQGPFARTLEAIEAYREVSYHNPGEGDDVMADITEGNLAELICLYAVGIVRGDGEGIASWPRPPVSGTYGDDDPF